MTMMTMTKMFGSVLDRGGCRREGVRRNHHRSYCKQQHPTALDAAHYSTHWVSDEWIESSLCTYPLRARYYIIEGMVSFYDGLFILDMMGDVAEDAGFSCRTRYCTVLLTMELKPYSFILYPLRTFIRR